MPDPIDLNTLRGTAYAMRRPAIPDVFRCRLLSAGALALSMFASASAFADSGGAWVTEVDQATIEVTNDGEDYTTVLSSSPPIKGRMSMSLDTHKYGRVKYWAYWPSIKAETSTGPGMQKEQYKELGYSKSYPLGDRPKTVSRDLPFSIPWAKYAPYVLDACNTLASELRSFQGMSNAEIFAVDRTLSIKVDAEITWKMSGSAVETPPLTEITGPGVVNPLIKDVTIKCKKTPPPPPVVPDVISSAVVVNGYDPVNFAGKCQMKLYGSILSNVPNIDVTFRYVDDKGNESDLKSVNTTADRSANFNHNYPLSPGHKTGKVRIVGENFNFTSGWKDYDFECGAEPTNDLLTLLPPKAKFLEVGPTAKEFRFKGHMCPAEAKMIGSYVGRGPTTGKAVLTVGGFAKSLEAFDVEDGDVEYIDDEYDLNWVNVEGSLRQKIEFALVLYNHLGAEVDRMTKKVTFTCRKLESVDNFASVDPKPKTVSLSVAGTGIALQSGYSCPARVLLTGNVQSNEHPLSGNVAFFANGEEFSQEALSLGAYSGSGFAAQHDLDWRPKAAPGQTAGNLAGPARTKQTIVYAMKVFNPHGAEIGKKLKTKEFSCVKLPSVVIPTSPPGKQASQMAAQPKFTILAPRNRVNSGEIRLSGAKPNQAHTLAFLRKTKSGYKLLNSPQLPKQMMGNAASFNPDALGNGTWRLKVCQLLNPDQCKQSDFYLKTKKKSPGLPEAAGIRSRR